MRCLQHQGNPQGASLLALLTYFFSSIAFAAGADYKEDTKGKKVQGKFSIAKDTTFIISPLDKDGYPDYVTALNERLRQGVSSDNNACVLIWQALGPNPGWTPAPEFFQRLGIQSPPKDGKYFVGFPRYIKEHLKLVPDKEGRAIRDQLESSNQRPWTTKEYPELAGWLKTNERPLALVVAATRRTHYYSPLLPDSTDKGSSGLLEVQRPYYRELARALLARALLRAGEGADAATWQDLQACHRLGRLISRGGTLDEGLAGMAIDYSACRADLAFLDRTRPDAKQIEAYLRDLQELPPLPDMAEKIDLYERFGFLDSVMMMDRRGFKYLEVLAGGPADPNFPPKDAEYVARWAPQAIDWDPALRKANRLYDNLACAMREKDRDVRQKKLREIYREETAFRGKAMKEALLIELHLGAASAKGRFLGDIMLGIMFPAWGKAQNASDRARQTEDNTVLAFALAWHERDHGRYPKELAALTPKYLKQIPKDLFSGKALIYTPRERSYLLYSVGVNRKDEGGRGHDDDPQGDDLAVRMPVEKQRD